MNEFAWLCLFLTLHSPRSTSVPQFCGNSYKMQCVKDNLVCEPYFIEKIYEHIANLRTINGYLKHKLDNYASQVRNCSDTAYNGTHLKCPIPAIYTSCDVAIKNGPGVYLLQPPQLNITPFMSYCGEDPHGDAPWLFIQRRMTTNVNFKRSWSEYERGFGNLYGSFWLGLSKIYTLTMDQQCELWICLKDATGVEWNGKYTFFIVGNRDMSYNLHGLGTFSGNIMDSLRDHEGYKFSTPDRDNGDKQCPSRGKGGWWFTDKCGESQLNEYFEDKGLPASAWGGSTHRIVYAHMAVREYNPLY